MVITSNSVGAASAAIRLCYWKWRTKDQSAILESVNTKNIGRTGLQPRLDFGRHYMMRLSTIAFCIVCALAWASTPAVADTKNDEISYLINSVGKSGCSFIRNGERYSGKDARQHLRSKRKLNAHLIHSAEDFIEKIASRSSNSGQPYMISCQGKEQQMAKEWFTRLLALHRSI